MINEVERAKQIIQALFPPDSEFAECAVIGRRLLEQAKRDCASWRNESDAVLIRFAQLCEAEESRQNSRTERSRTR